MSDTRDALMVTRNSDGKLVKRPLSPHLQVYRPQVSTGLSITHRITGIGLSVGTLLLTWWLLAAAAGPVAYGHVQGFVGSFVGLVLLFGWTASLFYHFFAGIRHLAWDSGYGFGIKEFHLTGYATLIATAAATVLVWIVGLAIWHHAGVAVHP